MRMAEFVAAAAAVAGALSVCAAVADVSWHAGYVASDSHPDKNLRNKVFDDSRDAPPFAYSDVIKLPKAGMKIEFLDPSGKTPSDNVYVVSNWRMHKGEWEFDGGEPHYKGKAAQVVKTGEKGTLYSYVSSGPENVRLTYPSLGAFKTNPPKVEITDVSSSEAGTWMDEHKTEMDARNAWLAADRERAYFKELEGKKILFIGDSYLDGNGLPHKFVWPVLLKDKYSLLIDLHGRNGAAIGMHDPNRNPMPTWYEEAKIPEPVANEASKKPAAKPEPKRRMMASKTKTKPKNEPKAPAFTPDPDVIVIEGGRNDFNVNTPIGKNDSTDPKTLKGALRTMVAAFREKYPNAKIVLFGAYDTDDNWKRPTCTDYGRAVSEMAKELGTACINTVDRGSFPVKMYDGAWRAKYCLGDGVGGANGYPPKNDRSHLNFEGMKLLFPYVEKVIAESLR